MAHLVSSRKDGTSAQQENGGNPIGENRLQFAGEELFRPLTFGTKWTSIRIGIRYAFWGVTMAVANNFTIGVSQYNCGFLSNNLTGDAWTAGFAAATWTVAGSPTYYGSGSSVYFYRKFGSAQASTSTAFTPYFSADPRYVRSVLYISLTKTSTTYSCTVFAPNTTGLGQTDWSRAEFQKGMWTTGTPTNTAASGAMALSNTGSTGLADHVLLSWPGTSPVPELWDVAVTRFY